MRIFRSPVLRCAPAVFLAWLLPASASAAVIRVPDDYALISLGVAAAKAGDVVEVADGYYFENNIVIDKAITLRSQNLYGAVVSGSDENGEAVFLVRAACRIEGFIIKEARAGILQRDSPDVEWEGKNLALFHLSRGIAIDDREYRRGAARLSEIIVAECGTAVATNDARSVDIRRALIVNADTAFNGFDHLAFTASEIIAWNCRQLTGEEKGSRIPAPSTNRILLGRDIYSYDSKKDSGNSRELRKTLDRMFQGASSDTTLPRLQIRRLEALLLMIVGDIVLQSGKPAMAAEHYQAALAADPAKPRSEATWRSLIGLSSAAEARGDMEAAIAFLKKAADITEAIGAGIPVQSFQSGFTADKVGIYEKLIGHLVERDRKFPGQGFDRDALWYAEKSRARGFMVGLRTGSPASAIPGLEKILDRWRTLNQAVSRLQVRLQEPDLPEEQRKELLGRLELDEKERAAAILTLRRRQLEAGRLSYPDPYGFDEIRKKLLGPEAGLLEFVLGERRSFAFLAASDGLSIAVLPPAAELRPQIARYLQFLGLRETGDFRGREGGRSLAAVLLGPFRSRLSQGIKTLTIVPDGALHYLPFEALLWTEGGRERFLVEDFEIFYGPSASGLIRLAERPAPANFRMDFLGLANSRAMSVFSSSEPERIRFPELSFAGRELRAIQKFYPADRSVLLLGEDAREERFKALPLADFRVIHLVAHGFFDDRNWHRSALLLLPSADGREDGFVQANDVIGLKLVPELLVLSGCQTGAGYLQKGEGLTGLASSFFFAGARAILLSLWNVNDKAAAVFMESFYRHYAAGKAKADALRRAKLEMLRSSYRHPFYWASFILQGR